MGYFVIRAVASGIKFDLKASNGQTVATSEVYRTRSACLRGILSVQKNAPQAPVADLTVAPEPTCSNPRFELYRDKHGAYRFRLKARNGSIIAVSEDYSTHTACENGIESVRKNGVSGEILEFSQEKF